MIKNLFILLTLFGVIMAATYVTDKNSPQQPPKDVTKTFSAMPDFDFLDIQGSTHTFYDYAGKPVILHFWATWCAPCIEEFPDLVKLARQHPNDLTIIAIAVADEIPKIKQFMKKEELDIPQNMLIGLDPNKNISKKMYSTVQLPESYIFTHRMNLKEKIIGAYDHWPEYRLP